MKPDSYSTSSATPITALAGWLSITNTTKAEMSLRASISRNTGATACKGAGVKQGTAVLIGHATGLPADVIKTGELRRHWAFDLDASGKVRVIEVTP
jgi:hypothetical protein